MQSDRKRKLSVTSKGATEEYCLRRPKEDPAKMKTKIPSSTPVSGKRKPWSWEQYLEEERTMEETSAAAPVTLFTEAQSFPTSKNGFKVGMRLEGIDPLHPSMFCVLSVAEVIGFRMRLHIDGYSECYDFWVNADSHDIRPVGWCQATGHKLHPPKGYSEAEFSWEKHLSSCDSQAAPHTLFRDHSKPQGPYRLEVGMKLEAVDRKNPCLVCVASVADILDQHFLVHFDNWDDTYDYWCDASSPHIHPVGWCQDHGRPLTAPQGHPNPEHFLWEEYLEDNSCTAVPSQAFTMRAPHGFQVNMKLEAVDRRNPMLIRVATIADTEDYRVKIHFDGWQEKFDFWVDSDHCDLHPVGWCSSTGHPLEPPLSAAGPSDLKPVSAQGVCPTPGCRGVGHIKGAKYSGHHSAFGCPYSDLNVKKEVVIPDRLGGEKQITFVPVHFVQKTKRLLPDELDTPLHDNTDGLAQSTKYVRVKKEEEEDEDEEELLANVMTERGVGVDSLQQALHQSVFLSSGPGLDLPLCWEQHCKLLPGVAGVQASLVEHWSVEEVADFLQSLPGCEEQAKRFREEQIDGKAFLLLTQRDIVKIMSVKLGPALKIFNAILMFKHAEERQSAPSHTHT